MKKKTLTYLMLVVVLAVWGKVVFDFVDLSSGDTITSPSAIQQVLPEVESGDSSVYVLNGDYPDPFLGKLHKVKSQVSKPKAANKPVKTKPVPIQEKKLWPEIGYHGFMMNQSAGKQMAILAIDGKQVLLTVGDSVSGIIVENIYPDSLVLAFDDEFKTINK